MEKKSLCLIKETVGVYPFVLEGDGEDDIKNIHAEVL